jgi:hypothetical protein
MANVNLDLLDLSPFASLFPSLFAELETYHKCIEAMRTRSGKIDNSGRAGEMLIRQAMTAWLKAGSIALRIEQEFARIELDPNASDSTSSPTGKCFPLVELREWLIDIRDKNLQGWGERFPPTVVWNRFQRGAKRIPNLKREMYALAILIPKLAEAAGTPKGKPGRRGYPLKALDYAKRLKRKHPGMKAEMLRRMCLQKFSEDNLPPDGPSFRAWLTRERTNRTN